MKRLKVIAALLTLTVVTLLGISSIASASPLTLSGTLKDNACAGLNELDSGSNCNDPGASQSTISHTIAGIVNILSFIIGVAAIIVIMISGFRYITSGGAADKISSAKNSLIYALIGLIIAALAQVLVHFVLNTTYRAAKTTYYENALTLRKVA